MQCSIKVHFSNIAWYIATLYYNNVQPRIDCLKISVIATWDYPGSIF